MKRTAYVTTAGVLAALVAAAGCSHDSGRKESRAGSGAFAGGAAAAVGGAGASAGQSGALRPAGVPPNHAPRQDALSGDSAPGAVASGSERLLTGAAKIRTAELTVAVRDARSVAAKADEADAVALRAGGEVDADDRTSGRHATATLRLLVPPAALLPTLDALSRLGTEKFRQLATTDVTQQVADVSSRVASERDSIARLRTLYASAQKVRDVIDIESELNSREADLESLQAQQRALSRETAQATITLHLLVASKAKAVAHHKRHHHRGGFLGGLGRGWHGLTHAANWLANALGTLLPFVALAALLAAGARVLWGRRRPAPAPSE